MGQLPLLSIPGKVSVWVLLNRLSGVAENLFPDAQCGFRAGRVTADIIFSLKRIQEKCIEQNMPLFMMFADFAKAFDTDNCSLLWIMLAKIGCLERFVNLVTSFSH